MANDSLHNYNNTRMWHLAMLLLFHHVVMHACSVNKRHIVLMPSFLRLRFYDTTVQTVIFSCSRLCYLFDSLVSCLTRLCRCVRLSSFTFFPFFSGIALLCCICSESDPNCHFTFRSFYERLLVPSNFRIQRSTIISHSYKNIIVM